MKFVKNCLKNFILRSDMFAAQPNLRFNGSGSYETIFGGCLSILLVIGFAIIFGQSFINVLNMVNVKASINLQDNPYDSNEVNDIKLAVGIKDIDFSQSQRYFNIILKQRTQPLGPRPPSIREIPLYSCQKKDWEDLGQNFGKLFEVYNMSKMLCPSPSQNLSVKGFAGSQSWVTVGLFVQQCMNFTGVNWTCYSPMEIQDKINSQLTMMDFFKVDLLVLNTVISPDNQDPIKKVLQNQIFITFSNTSGSRCQVKLGRYEIVTDNSIWPVSSQSTIQGHYITSHESYTINLYSTHYVRVQIQKARTIYTVTRYHDKLDEMLSYVGGLFALLFGWIFFFISSYNEYRYQIAVGQHTFAMDQFGRKIQEKNFGFITYLGYAIYDWLKTFNIPVTWPKMQQIDAAREEANQQMDIKYLMKRLQHFQKINKLLLGQHNLICSSLTRHPTLQQAKRLRKIVQYYDKVIKMQNQEKLVLGIFKLNDESSISTNKAQVFNAFMLTQNKQMKDSKITQIKPGQPKIQQKDKKQSEIQDQLDSDDQEIQKQILKAYKRSNQRSKLKNEYLLKKILNQIPQSIRDRFAKLSKKQQKDCQYDRQMSQLQQIQSNFSLQQDNSFQKLQ